MKQEFYTIEECWQKLGVSKATLYRMIKAGRFPEKVKLSDRKVGVRREDYDLWKRIIR